MAGAALASSSSPHTDQQRALISLTRGRWQLQQPAGRARANSSQHPGTVCKWCRGQSSSSMGGCNMKMNTFSSRFFKVILAKNRISSAGVICARPQLVLDVGGESGADPGHAEGILMSSVTPRHTGHTPRPCPPCQGAVVIFPQCVHP